MPKLDIEVLWQQQKSPHKGNAPFDPTDFDIDAFIVSDKLASRFPTKTKWRSGADIRRS
ncbi:hypothetical protein [Brevibacillus laterosporus]|uniref:hypothetical protein n=1 Tax=Brevibacillus laterosporus TaxID=1465 RepID=UPI0013C43B54|nr:hypothetical protein [Brevibacillus laterosporus]MBM7111694.1 hypothetical protein [Brevibacillus laterosporus]